MSQVGSLFNYSLLHSSGMRCRVCQSSSMAIRGLDGLGAAGICVPNSRWGKAEKRTGTEWEHFLQQVFDNLFCSGKPFLISQLSLEHRRSQLLTH